MKTFRTLTNAFLVIILSGTMIISSCKKDDKDNGPKLSEEQIKACVDGAKTISTEMQQFVTSSLSDAIEAGYEGGDVPDIDGGKKSGKLFNNSAYGEYSWSGPDSKGWYTRSYDSYGYKYSEKLLLTSDTVIYVNTMSWNEGNSDGKIETTTKYFKYTKNNKVLYKGYSLFDYDVSGYSDMSRVQWKIEFKDWNPLTNAGTYDWYIGVLENSGGDTFPLYRFLSMVTTESTNNWLHVKTTWYDEHGIKAWEYEYDTPCEPVDMPETPELK